MKVFRKGVLIGPEHPEYVEIAGRWLIFQWFLRACDEENRRAQEFLGELFLRRSRRYLQVV